MKPLCRPFGRLARDGRFGSPWYGRWAVVLVTSVIRCPAKVKLGLVPAGDGDSFKVILPGCARDCLSPAMNCCAKVWHLSSPNAQALMGAFAVVNKFPDDQVLRILLDTALLIRRG